LLTARAVGAGIASRAVPIERAGVGSTVGLLSISASLVALVNPQLFGPRLLAGWLAIEEQDVRLHSLGVKDACWQSSRCQVLGA